MRKPISLFTLYKIMYSEGYETPGFKLIGENGCKVILEGLSPHAERLIRDLCEDLGMEREDLLREALGLGLIGLSYVSLESLDEDAGEVTLN